MTKPNLDYAYLKINGMHYVRELTYADVDKNGKKESRIAGYLIYDNNNKPVKKAYHYLKECKKDGYTLNSLKRTAYDLSYFLDFLLFNNIDEELIDYDYFFNFVSEYLTVINPKFKVEDCIERSMLKSIPVLDVYKNDNVIAQNKNNIDGLKVNTIRKIANTAKDYLIYLKFIRHYDIEVDRIFKIADVSINYETTSGHLYKSYKRIYSTDNIIKNAKLPVINTFATPVDPEIIFEDYEMDKFFCELKKCLNPSYKLLFYLLSITGMRVSEALALKIFKVEYNGKNINFTKMESDIILEDDSKNEWAIDIVIRPNNPDDLKVKFDKPRKIKISDKSKTLRNLLTQVIMFRKLKFNKKSPNHEFLFVNRSGNRLKYHVVEQRFNAVINEAGLGDRKAGIGERNVKLTIHSFRHTFASKWMYVRKLQKVDVELDLLSEYLGHSSTEITKAIYIHFYKADYTRLMEQLEASSHQKEIIIT